MSKNYNTKNLDKAFGITWAFSNPKQAYYFAKSELTKKIKTSKLTDKNIPTYFECLDTLNINQSKLGV